MIWILTIWLTGLSAVVLKTVSEISDRLDDLEEYYDQPSSSS